MHNLSGIEMQFSVCMPTSGSSMGKAGTGLGWVLYLTIQGAGSSTLTVQGARGHFRFRRGRTTRSRTCD